MLPLVTCSWRRLQVHGAKHLIYCVQPPKPPTTTWHVGRHHCRSSRCQDLCLFVNSEQPVLLWKAGGPGSMPEHKEAPITSFFPRQGTTFFPRTGQFGSSPSQCNLCQQCSHSNLHHSNLCQQCSHNYNSNRCQQCRHSNLGHSSMCQQA